MKLAKIAYYVTDKISSESITLEEYVTTDSILQSKRGRVIASNLPPEKCTLTHFLPGDVLVANIRPYLKKVWYADIAGGCSSDVLVFRAKEGHNSQYLYALLLQDSFYAHSMNGSKGSKMPRGDKEQIMRYEIPMHLHEERIGSIIMNFNHKIAINRAINQNLEAIAKQLYDYWFVQFDFPDEEGMPYKSNGGKMVWNEKLKKEIPEKWSSTMIMNVADTYSGGTPHSTNNLYYAGGNIPWINSGELNNKILTNTTNYITQAGLNNSSAKIYPANSILVALYGATAGKVSYLSFEACSNQAVCGVMPQNNDLKEYLYFVLSSLYGYFVGLSTGSARSNISQDTVKNTKFVLPADVILVSFHNKVLPLLNAIIENQKTIDVLTKQRDELLPLLMNGQVTVNSDLSLD